MGSCISGDACMDTFIPLILLEKSARKAHREVEVLSGGCLSEVSQGSGRAGSHSSCWNRRQLKSITCPVHTAIASFNCWSM